jgi:hypothetical protein
MRYKVCCRRETGRYMLSSRFTALTRSRCPDPNRLGAAAMGKASRDAGQQSCNFILSALANLVVVLAKLTITLGQEEITGMDGRAIDEGLVRAEHRRRNCRHEQGSGLSGRRPLSPIQAWECHITVTHSGYISLNIGLRSSAEWPRSQAAVQVLSFST